MKKSLWGLCTKGIYYLQRIPRSDLKYQGKRSPLGLCATRCGHGARCGRGAGGVGWWVVGGGWEGKGVKNKSNASQTLNKLWWRWSHVPWTGPGPWSRLGDYLAPVLVRGRAILPDDAQLHEFYFHWALLPLSFISFLAPGLYIGNHTFPG